MHTINVQGEYDFNIPDVINYQKLASGVNIPCFWQTSVRYPDGCAHNRARSKLGMVEIQTKGRNALAKPKIVDYLRAFLIL